MRVRYSARQLPPGEGYGIEEPARQLLLGRGAKRMPHVRDFARQLPIRSGYRIGGPRARYSVRQLPPGAGYGLEEPVRQLLPG